MNRVDDIVDMLEALGEHKSEAEVNRKIARHLSRNFDVEQRTVFLREGLTRTTIDNFLRERHMKMNGSAGGGVNDLLAAGPSRGHHGAGQRQRKRGRGKEDKGSKVTLAAV